MVYRTYSKLSDRVPEGSLKSALTLIESTKPRKRVTKSRYEKVYEVRPDGTFINFPRESKRDSNSDITGTSRRLNSTSTGRNSKFPEMGLSNLMTSTRNSSPSRRGRNKQSSERDLTNTAILGAGTASIVIPLAGYWLYKKYKNSRNERFH